MNFEGNLARKVSEEKHTIPEEREEEVKKSDSELLRELRMKQVDQEFTPAERELFLELQKKEEIAKSGIEQVSELERNRFIELSKKDNLDLAESKELEFLYDRIEGRK